jgi:hypothetical protein
MTMGIRECGDTRSDIVSTLHVLNASSRRLLSTRPHPFLEVVVAGAHRFLHLRLSSLHFGAGRELRLGLDADSSIERLDSSLILVPS